VQSKWFRGWSATSEDEATADGVREESEYSRGYFDSAGVLTRLELYSRNKLSKVEYYAGEREFIRAEHARDYPGIWFSIVRKRRVPEGFSWGFSTRYDGEGKLDANVIFLLAPGDLEIMSLEYPAAGSLGMITKYYYASPDDLILAFEYDASGKNYEVAEMEEGRSVRLDDVLPTLRNPEFYADGLALPPELAGTSIQSVRDSFPI
jgi:hypothetical protein